MNHFREDGGWANCKQHLCTLEKSFNKTDAHKKGSTFEQKDQFCQK
jgi:hypothetical protein